MSKFNWMPILRTGTFTDKNKKVVTVKEEDLDRVIENTDLSSNPQLVVEHPKFDEIGFGSVEKLQRVGEILFALPKEVNDKFKKVVNEGKLPGRSVTLDEKTFALKNISFLPPQIQPAVSGLGSYNFSQENNSTRLQLILPEDASHFADLETSNFEFAQYEIAAWPFRNIQTLFRSFKNWLISKESLEVAEEIFPEYMMNDLDNPPPIYEKTNDANYFSQNQDGDKMKLDLTKLDPAVKAAFEALELQFNSTKTELEQKKVELQAATQTISAAQMEKNRSEVLQFCEGEDVKLKIKPADKEKVVNFLLAQKEKGVIEFSASGASTGSAPGTKVQFNSFDFSKELIKSLPNVVELSEVATQGSAHVDNLSDAQKIGKEMADFVNPKK